MIVGTYRHDDEMRRLHEYSPVFDAERFAAHEKFFVEDVRGWAQSRFGVALPAKRTAEPLGRRVARCGCGRCHDREGRVARRRVLERRVPADGDVGIWTLRNPSSFR